MKWAAKTAEKHKRQFGPTWIFALVPHKCWVCDNMFWLEWGKRRRTVIVDKTYRTFRCKHCHTEEG